MKLFYYILSISLLANINLNAQETDWQWAKRGGGNTSLSAGSSVYSTGRERVLEVAVDSQNNYYFLAEVGSSNVDYDGESITTYGDNSGDKNIFVFSTDCDGELRWKKSIGGGFHDFANSIKIDNNDNVYVTGKTINRHNSTPVHFDTDTIKNPAPVLGNLDDSFKGAFIIKYDQDGDFQWLVEPEGPISSTYNSAVMRMDIDENNTIHTLLYLVEGTHLEGQLEVDEDDSQTVIAKYDEDGSLIDFTLINLEPGTNGPYDYQFVYDANLSRYYIADTKRNSNDLISINGYGEASGNQKAFYLAALEEDGEVIWYHE
ncbi:MAG: SBBP repeat-containing protein, partial [Bacteroidota bacterium]